VTAPDGYKPLVYIDCEDDDGNPVTLPCWPNAPDPAQTTEETTSITVADFDRVVLAIPVGAIAEKTINGRSRCEDLYVDERFRRMATGMVTRGTRAVQLWFSTDLHGLGWRPVTDAAHGPVLGSYKPERKLNSWADMTQVAPREPWLNHTRPHNITYLCDVYDDPTDHATSTQCVHDEALSWLQNHAGGLWPCAANGFPWDKLIDPNNRTAAERFESQYWRANTKGSDRYVLGAPRTTRLRLDPHGDTQFTNLFLAGDWVKTPLNAGCVEGAAMGGRIAAQRILDLSPPQPLAPSPPPQTASSVSRGPSAPVAPPPYIARDGDLPLLPPVEMNHVKMHGYFVRADRVALQQLLADTFQHTGVTCELLIPVVMIASARCDEIRSARPDDGYLVENELGFWVPVRMTWSGGSSIGFYLPYLFVDDPAAWQAGRELYGFNKILSEFRYAKPDDVDPAEVRAQVLPTRARTTRLDKHTVATWSGFAAHTPLIHWSTGDVIEKMLRHVCDIFGHALPELSLPELSLPELPLFFLKQFRDARDGSSACERAVIAARARLRHDSMSGGLLLPHTHTLTLTRHATIDIANTLGLPDTITPDLGIWAEFSLTIDPGQVLA
jgi:hypothetical protein